MCRGVETATSIVFELLSEYMSPVAWVDLGKQESHREDVMVYPSSMTYIRPAQCFMHYTVLMILRLKSTQNGRLQQRVGRNFIGVSSVLILGYLAAGI